MKPNNDEFCILPWVHASISNTGKVSPCCRIIQYNPEPFGSLHKDTLADIRANPRFKEFREMMLNGQTPLNCKECHLQEMANMPTLRTLFNKKYESIAQKVKTNKINELLAMKYGEVRFSNVCNLACRTCGIESSSRWHKDHITIHGDSKKVFHSHANKDQGLISDFIKNIDEVDTIYFAGGEPLLQQGHYELLQTLIEMNRTDITLVYNSNLTTLKLGSNHVFHLWEKFKTVTI
jgi:radical SAM protein with 4Fe4S-binding SPASM domain